MGSNRSHGPRKYDVDILRKGLTTIAPGQQERCVLKLPESEPDSSLCACFNRRPLSFHADIMKRWKTDYTKSSAKTRLLWTDVPEHTLDVDSMRWTNGCCQKMFFISAETTCPSQCYHGWRKKFQSNFNTTTPWKNEMCAKYFQCVCTTTKYFHDQLNIAAEVYA